MFTFASVDQEEICGSCNWCWVGLGSTVLAQLTLSPLPSPAPLTACGGVPGASPPWCVCTSRAVTPQTAVATGSAWPGTATATATSGQVPPVTPWTAALPTAACTASAAPVSPALCHTEGLQGRQGLPVHPWRISLGNLLCLPASHQLGGWGCSPSPPASEAQMVAFGSQQQGWAGAWSWKLPALCLSFPFCPRLVLFVRLLMGRAVYYAV